jgi:hypothetical protein
VRNSFPLPATMRVTVGALVSLVAIATNPAVAINWGHEGGGRDERYLRHNGERDVGDQHTEIFVKPATTLLRPMTTPSASNSMITSMLHCMR